MSQTQLDICMGHRGHRCENKVRTYLAPAFLFLPLHAWVHMRPEVRRVDLLALPWLAPKSDEPSGLLVVLCQAAASQAPRLAG